MCPLDVISGPMVCSSSLPHFGDLTSASTPIIGHSLPSSPTQFNSAVSYNSRVQCSLLKTPLSMASFVMIRSYISFVV
jgi:hypothetical protein